MKNQPIHMTPQLKQAVLDAQLALTYAAQIGLEVEERILRILVQAQYRLTDHDWTNEAEADFWQAFSTLNVLIKPVSVESLKAASLVETKAFRFRFLRVFNKAHRTAMLYVGMTVFFILLLVSIQVYWLIGAKLSQTLATLTEEIRQISRLAGFSAGEYTDEYNTLRMRLETTRETLLFWSKVWNWSPRAGADAGEGYHRILEEDYDAEITALQERLKDATRTLSDLKAFSFYETGMELVKVYQARVNALTEQLILKKTDYAKQKYDYTFAEIELKTRTILQILQTYILPLLYGIAGAMAYILRALIQDIQRETYTSKMGIRYGARMFLGALAGLLIGFFITPQGAAGISSLPPMALSFLAGYSVELWFLLMDRAVVLLSTKKRQPKTQS